MEQIFEIIIKFFEWGLNNGFVFFNVCLIFAIIITYFQKKSKKEDTEILNILIFILMAAVACGLVYFINTLFSEVDFNMLWS